MAKEKQIAVTEFKAKALQLLDEVAETHETLVITKRGRPFAQVLPFTPSSEPVKPGGLAHTFLFEEDAVSPLGEEIWDAC